MDHLRFIWDFLRRPNTLLTLSYCGSFLSLGLLIAGLGPSLPTFGRNTQSSDAAMGGAVTSRALGYLAGATTGPIFHKLQGNILVACSLVVTAVVSFVIPHLHHFWLIAALFFSQGISMGMLDTGCNLMTLWLHGEHCDPYVQALHASFAVGAVVSPLVLQSVISHGIDLSYAWYGFGASFIPWIVALFYFESPQQPASESEKESNLFSFDCSRIFQNNFKPYLAVLGISIFLLAYVGGEVATGSFLSTFAIRRELTDEAGGAFISFIFWLLFAIGRLIAIPISKFVSPAAMLSVDLVGALVSVVLIWKSASNYTFLLISLSLYGLFLASTFPSAITMLQKIMPVTGNMATVFIIGASAGEMLIPLIVSNTFVATNYMSLIYVEFGSIIAGTITMLFVAYIGHLIVKEKQLLKLTSDSVRAADPTSLELSEISTGVTSEEEPTQHHQTMNEFSPTP